MTDIALVADIGGTNARFAIAEYAGLSISIREMKVFRTADYDTLSDAAHAFLKTVSVRPSQGCFAAAGPMSDGEIEFTNSQWTLNADDISKILGFSNFRVVNDFFALAAGVAHLPPPGMTNVKSGMALGDAPQLVLGPGTGFGQALIVPTQNGRKIIATEGGHVTFAPQSEDEYEIRKFIARTHARVSVERVLSGDGLVNIYHAICATSGATGTLSHAVEISAATANGTDAYAARAIDVFCTILGGVAGDAVLATGARGGVILAGGILPQIRDAFLRSDFAAAFIEKGRMTDYVRPVPVDLVIADDAALLGAAASLVESEGGM